jgi:aspartyl-tRNA synthetase
LRIEEVGKSVTLCGWVDSYRDHGRGLFVDLRDRYGKTQIVFEPESGAAVLELARTLRSEYVILVTGHVERRPEGATNPKLATGQIEVRATKLEVLNKSLTPPVQPGGQDLPNEDLRLKHRYLDLRRSEMQNTLFLRHKIIRGMRNYFDEHAFIDVETPMLGRSTPEGARDYLVPSRIHHG